MSCDKCPNAETCDPVDGEPCPQNGEQKVMSNTGIPAWLEKLVNNYFSEQTVLCDKCKCKRFKRFVVNSESFNFCVHCKPELFTKEVLIEHSALLAEVLEDKSAELQIARLVVASRNAFEMGREIANAKAACSEEMLKQAVQELKEASRSEIVAAKATCSEEQMQQLCCADQELKIEQDTSDCHGLRRRVAELEALNRVLVENGEVTNTVLRGMLKSMAECEQLTCGDYGYKSFAALPKPLTQLCVMALDNLIRSHNLYREDYALENGAKLTLSKALRDILTICTKPGMASSPANVVNLVVLLKNERDALKEENIALKSAKAGAK